jgi:hypothetical protein
MKNKTSYSVHVETVNPAVHRPTENKKNIKEK